MSDREIVTNLESATEKAKRNLTEKPKLTTLGKLDDLAASSASSGPEGESSVLPNFTLADFIADLTPAEKRIFFGVETKPSEKELKPCTD